jgi:hypothetical protein
MYFDFHLHSTYSYDSIIKPEEIIKISIKKGLSGVAVTDHDTISGGLKTKSLATDNFLVIVGAEIKTNECEVIGLFLNEEIKKKTFVEVIDEIKDQGGITILPHPFKDSSIDAESLAKEVDLIEVLNSRLKPESNNKALNLAKKYKIPQVAGSDAHIPFEIGAVRNNLPIQEPDQEEVRKMLLKGTNTLSGNESMYPIRMLSKVVGRYKRGGAPAIAKSLCKKMRR